MNDAKIFLGSRVDGGPVRDVGQQHVKPIQVDAHHARLARPGTELDELDIAARDQFRQLVAIGKSQLADSGGVEAGWVA
jgi:hypothetical protein